MERLVPITDPVLSWYGAWSLHPHGGGLRPERFPPGTAARIGGGDWPLANLRSPAGTALVFATDARRVVLAVERLRHHQATGNAFALVAEGPAGEWQTMARVDVRKRRGACRIEFRLAEQQRESRRLWLWLPPISSCVLSGLYLPREAGLVAASPPAPRWLAIGDSITQGFAVDAYDRTWVHSCQQAWGLPARNLGFGGALVEPEVFLSAQGQAPYELVTVALGGNHAWHDEWVEDLAEPCRRLAEGLLAVGHQRVAWLLPSPKPCAIGAGPASFAGLPLDARFAANGQRVREILREVLATYEPAVTVVDGLLPPDPGLLPDGIHPAVAGHKLYAERLGQRLIPIGRRI